MYLVPTISLQYRFKAPMANSRYSTYTTLALTLSQKHFFSDIYVTTRTTSGKDKLNTCSGAEISTDIICSGTGKKTPTYSPPMQSEKLTTS